MKIMKWTLSLLAGLMMFASCGTIEEDIYISKNGDGNYVLKSDMLPMLKGFASSMGEGDVNIEDKLWKDFPGEEVDSIIDLRSRMTEEQLADPKMAKLLDKMEVFMRGSRKSGVLYMGAQMKFASIADLNALSSAGETQDGTESAPTSEPGAMPTSLPISKERKFTLANNTLTCTDKGQNTMEDLSMKEQVMVNKMIKDAEFITRIHSKDRIKKASGFGLVSFNDSVATFKYDFQRMSKGKDKQNFVIEFY
ncbi:MAG: hypothetical protein RL660_3041 [Bacteroidota bacterium]